MGLSFHMILRQLNKRLDTSCAAEDNRELAAAPNGKCDAAKGHGGNRGRGRRRRRAQSAWSIFCSDEIGGSNDMTFASCAARYAELSSEEKDRLRIRAKDINAAIDRNSSIDGAILRPSRVDRRRAARDWLRRKLVCGLPYHDQGRLCVGGGGDALALAARSVTRSV